MIETLEDAWKWYESAVKLHRLTQRIGRRFWDREEWAAALAADNHFRDLSSPEIAVTCQTFESELDDLAVLVLFSVYEAIVRERVRDEIDRETPGMKQPFLIQAVREMKESLTRVSDFYESRRRILRSGPSHLDLVSWGLPHQPRTKARRRPAPCTSLFPASPP